MQQIIECVPNFSEGKRVSVIKKIAAAAKKIPGVTVLDTEWDSSHNRSLVTIVGSPDPVFSAAFAMIATAVSLINMEKHTGEHPRIGAVDVVPFIPVSGVSLQECVLLAKKLGEKVGNELHIPVFLYEAAAARPDRVNLATVRKGQYEGLKEAIQIDPDRKPDFGPYRLHPTAGAMVIGARKYLIAYNINLKSTDVDIAKKIAGKIRESNGGLPGIKALGFLVDGHAQISLNVVDYERTNIDIVFACVRKEAEALGVTILNSEVYGMIPLDAVVRVVRHTIQSPGFSASQILEKKLYE